MDEEKILNIPVIGRVVKAFEDDGDDTSSATIRLGVKVLAFVALAVVLILAFWGVYRLARLCLSYFGM